MAYASNTMESLSRIYAHLMTETWDGGKEIIDMQEVKPNSFAPVERYYKYEYCDGYRPNICTEYGVCHTNKYPKKEPVKAIAPINPDKTQPKKKRKEKRKTVQQSRKQNRGR